MFTHLLINSTVHRLQIKVADSYNWSVFTEGNRMLFWSLFCRNLPHTPITVHWLNALTSKCIKQIYQPSAEGAGLLKLYTIFWNILQLYNKWTMIVKPRIMFFFFFFLNIYYSVAAWCCCHGFMVCRDLVSQFQIKPTNQAKANYMLVCLCVGISSPWCAMFLWG